jgi:alkylation response protein AidB-like acyl-CoA dehydrogenase
VDLDFTDEQALIRQTADHGSLGAIVAREYGGAELDCRTCSGEWLARRYHEPAS